MPEKISNLTQSIENNNALRQALVVIEHKIRNLEKRKTKLESYRTIQSSGKELSSDQKAAVAKYDEVAQSLEFARDLSKQMLQIANASEKEEKKRARKETILRAQAETAKIREVLTIQNILVAFSDENVRNDFLNGVNGAVKLEQSDLNVMEKFCLDIQIKRQESPSDQPFLVSAQKAAEHFSLTIDGRPKQYGDTTYESVKGIFQKIQDSGYLDRAGSDDVIFEEEEPSEEQVEESTTNENEQNDPESVTERISDVESTQKVDPSPPCTNVLEEPQPVKTPISQIIPVQIDQQQNNMPKFTSEAPSAAAVPAPAFPPAPQTPVSTVVAPGTLPTQLQQPQIALQQIQRQQGPHQIPLQHAPPSVQQIPAPSAPAQIQGVPAPGHFPPTTVRAVEQAYFKQQYIQQMRPLAEVIGGGNFFFLQDSELDSPDMIGLPAPPHGFPAGQSQHPQQQPQSQQQTLTENQQANVVNLPAASPTQTQQLPGGLSAIQQQQNGITQVSNVQQGSQQQQTQQQQPQSQPQQSQQQPQISKQSVNSLPTPQANISGQPVPNNLTEQPTTAIPTQTFTNQSFPPIVPPPQVQSMFPQAATNSHSSPGIHQQTSVVNINPNVSNEKSQQPSSVVTNSPLQQTQTNQSQAPQITQVFNPNHSTMPSITPHQLIAHHQQQQQQQQTLSAQSQQSVAGTTNNLSLAEQQVAALATLQQQHHNAHPQLQQSATNQSNLPGLPTGFVNAKFPSNIVSASQAVSAQQQQQQPTQIPPHHSLNNQSNNINSGATGTLSQQSSQDKYDQTVRILEHKAQKIEIKERTNPVQVKDIIATASVNDWETDATKLQMQQQTSQQVHKPPSHYSTSHNTSHFHTAQHHNTNNNANNSASDRAGSNINESNQWSNDMHTNSQHTGQNSSNNATSGLNNKNNDWVSTFDSQESNHWNNSEASTNYRGRQSFNRNDRTNGGGPGNSGIRNDRNDNSRSGNSGGYRGRSSYSTSQNSNGNSSGPGGGNGGGMAGGNRNSVYFRNNDNYYQNGNNNGYNGGNKDNGGNRYGGGGNNGESYRGRPTPGGGNAGGGPRSGGSGPPPRQQRGSLGNAGGGSGGMGPRGQTGGPRASTGAYSSRPPRQQDVNVVN